MMDLPLTLVALALGSLFLYIAQNAYERYAYQSAMRRAGCQPIPRYPHRDPLGYDLYKITAEGAVKGDTLSMRRKLFSTYGNTFSSNWIGQPVVSTCDRENIQTVLGTSAKSFIQSPLRNKIAEPLLGKGLLTLDGEPWHRARGLAMSVLGKEQAADLWSLERHIQKMLELIPRDGSIIDLQPLLKRLFIDKGTELILGESINSLSSDQTSPEIESYLNLFETALRTMGARLRLGNLRFTRGPDLEWQKTCRRIYATLDRFVDEALERKSSSTTERLKKYTLIDKYLEVTDDREEIKYQIISVFLGARDQIGIAMSLLMFVLARHPAVWAKLRKESLADPSPLTIEKLKEHKYAKQVVQEGFRYYAAVQRSIRHCNVDCVLPHGGGKDGLSPVLVQRGTQVEMDFGVVHRDRAIWGEDADEFVPERWEDGQSRGWSWMPFLNRKRACPAMQMALTQMIYTVIRLSQEFKAVENRDPVWELVDDMRNVRQSRNGVKVSMVWA